MESGNIPSKTVNLTSKFICILMHFAGSFSSTCPLQYEDDLSLGHELLWRLRQVVEVYRYISPLKRMSKVVTS